LKRAIHITGDSASGGFDPDGTIYHDPVAHGPLPRDVTDAVRAVDAWDANEGNARQTPLDPLLEECFRLLRNYRFRARLERIPYNTFPEHRALERVLMTELQSAGIEVESDTGGPSA
jgi:hypothetical protein